MDSYSRPRKSTPRSRGRGRRSSSGDPTAMEIDPASPQVPHMPVPPGATVAPYMAGTSAPITPYAAYHHQTSYINPQGTMYGYFAYNVPPPIPQHVPQYVLHPQQPIPPPVDPITHQTQENVSSGESEAQSSHGSTRARTWIEPDGNGFFPNDGIVSRISLIFQSKFDGAWPTWRKVPKAVRDLWFGEFKKWYMWDPMHEDRIRKNFEDLGNARLRDFFAKARKLKKKPVWLGDTQWAALQQHWDNEHYRKVRDIAQKNKIGTPESGDPSLRTCGSVPMHKHRRRLSAQLGTEPTVIELFTRSHKLKGKEDAAWVDKKSQQIYEIFERDFQEAINSQGTGDDTSSDPSQPYPNPNKLWVKMFKNKKDRIYGIGDEAVNLKHSGYFSPSQRSGSTSSAPSQQEFNDLRGVVTNLGGELTAYAESYRMLMEKCKQLEEANQLLTQSNQQLTQKITTIDKRLEAFFRMQQASGSGSRPVQQNEDEGEEEEEEDEEDDAALGD